MKSPLVLASLVLALLSGGKAAQGFVVSSTASTLLRCGDGQQSLSRSVLSAALDDDDTSTLDALLRFGPAPAIVRITQSQKYWDAVDKFQREEGCSRVVAVRNMDAYFTDPNGWLVARDRAKKYGEVKDYTQKSGIQKRPIFSTFWALFCFWFFLVFLPTRISDLGGVQPSALTGGLCTPDISIVRNGKKEFECTKNIPLDELDKIYKERAIEKEQRAATAAQKGFRSRY